MEELVRRNHSITILVPDASPSINYNSSRDAAKFNFLVFKVMSSSDLTPFHWVSLGFSELLNGFQRVFTDLKWVSQGF